MKRLVALVALFASSLTWAADEPNTWPKIINNIIVAEPSDSGISEGWGFAASVDCEYAAMLSDDQPYILRMLSTHSKDIQFHLVEAASGRRLFSTPYPVDDDEGDFFSQLIFSPTRSLSNSYRYQSLGYKAGAHFAILVFGHKYGTSDIKLLRKSENGNKWRFTEIPGLNVQDIVAEYRAYLDRNFSTETEYAERSDEFSLSVDVPAKIEFKESDGGRTVEFSLDASAYLRSSSFGDHASAQIKANIDDTGRASWSINFVKD